MMTLLLSSMGIMITSKMAPKQTLWATTISQAKTMLLGSAIMLTKSESTWTLTNSSWKLTTDAMSTPLLLLSFWLIPVSLLASIGHLSNKAKSKKRTFISLMLSMLMALIMTFSSTKLMMFFLGFESTLMPTLFLMSRWGGQQERMEAGYYFVFYTLISSLPLLMGLIILYKKENHLSMPLFSIKGLTENYSLIPLCCLMAFLVKVPMFGVHLWLPKAHVEAPVAGSMMLAAMLLKMGGYGFLRLSSMFSETFMTKMAPILMPYCCWGGVLTSLMCITQTDLKSLMAYSSVSHMSFMMAGMSLMSSWGATGGMMMMMAHGMASSALFSMAKIYYERTSTRTLSMSRGIKCSILLLPLFWLIFSCAKLGLPPLPKAMGEVFLFTSLMNFNPMKMMTVLGAMVLTAMFSLTVFQLLKSGSNFKWNTKTNKMKEREYLLLSLHLVPLIMLMFKPNLMSI